VNLAEVRTIADLRDLGRTRLPRAVFDFGGADDELTLRRNTADWDISAWHPRALVDVSGRDCSGTVPGVRPILPLIVVPTGLASLAWACADLLLAQPFSVPFTISTSSNLRIEKIRRDAPDARLWSECFRV
jgi:isopentenyl diphosphate isomerase/L-lactate dehydrogenase-like FMN-dependent dehydrogenase